MRYGYGTLVFGLLWHVHIYLGKGGGSDLVMLDMRYLIHQSMQLYKIFIRSIECIKLMVT
jgi:hypothetical protein